MGRIERQLLGILLALNRVFTPSVLGKWTPQIVARLAIKPPDFLERTRQVWFLPEDKAVAAADVLIHDVLALVDAAFPEIDTMSVRPRIAAGLAAR